MASKTEQQYKLLNAELMDQVQKQRMEIGAYRKQLIAMNHEIMGLREAQILQNARHRQDNIGIIRGLMRSLDIDADCLADRTLTSEKEQEKEPEASFVVSRRSQSRRSSRDICQELRRSSALAYSTRTISPTRRRDTIVEVPNEAPESTPRLTHTPPPRRVAQLADDGSSEEEPESTTPDKEALPPATEEAEQRQGDDRLFCIIEDSDEETSAYSCSSSSPICCDSTIEEQTPPRRALRSVDPNVVPMMTREKAKPTKSLAVDLDNSAEEQRSIQLPRLCVTRPSQSPVQVQSLLRSVSLADATQSSLRGSLFEGVFRMSGTNTSTPIRNKASQQQRKTTTEAGEEEGCATTSRRRQPKGRVRKLVSEGGTRESDLSTSCLSSSGRPSRKCRPEKLSEPSLRDKMRNNSVDKKRKK